MEAPIPFEHEYETGCPIWLWPGSLEIGQQSGRVRRGLWAVARPLERVSVGAIPEFIPMFLPGLGELRAGKNGTGGPLHIHGMGMNGSNVTGMTGAAAAQRDADTKHAAEVRKRLLRIGEAGGGDEEGLFSTCFFGPKPPGVTNVERSPYNTGGRDPDLG